MSANRTRLACNPCRRQKVKCEREDNGEQCKRCQARGYSTCDTGDTAATPTPAPTASNFQNRLTSLEKQVRSLRVKCDLIMQMLARDGAATDNLPSSATGSRAASMSEEQIVGDSPMSPVQSNEDDRDAVQALRNIVDCMQDLEASVGALTGDREAD